MRLNMLAVGIVLLNIAVALSIYFIDGGIDLPMIVGILYGAVTNTPGLGAAQEALNQINYTGDPIALGYACAYPLGVVGIIGSIIAIRYICRVNLKKEEQELNTQEADVKHQRTCFTSKYAMNQFRKDPAPDKGFPGTSVCMFAHTPRGARQYPQS